MGAASRNKGKTGEREFLNALQKLLDLPHRIPRNLNQSDQGGADCVALPGIAIEIKRREALSRREWWKQALSQAEAIEASPVLAYRQNRKEWIIVTTHEWAGLTMPEKSAIRGFADTVQMTLDEFAVCFMDKPGFKLLQQAVESAKNEEPPF